MSERVLVMQVLGQKLREAFNKGDFVDAQNIEAFLASVERMGDKDFADLSEGSSDCLPA